MRTCVEKLLQRMKCFFTPNTSNTSIATQKTFFTELQQNFTEIVLTEGSVILSVKIMFTESFSNVRCSPK